MGDGFVGEIRLFAGDFVPREWVLCDGALRSIGLDGDSPLQFVIGNRFGGDGVNTYGMPNLPDPAPGLRYVICLYGVFPAQSGSPGGPPGVPGRSAPQRSRLQPGRLELLRRQRHSVRFRSVPAGALLAHRDEVRGRRYQDVRIADDARSRPWREAHHLPAGLVPTISAARRDCGPQAATRACSTAAAMRSTAFLMFSIEVANEMRR